MRNKVGELRPSQFITTFGPGSIVDLPDYSVMVAGTDKWDNIDVSKSKDIDEPRIKRKLKINQIKSIPTNTGSDGHSVGTIPSYRFPEYHVCPNCRKLGKRNGNDFFEQDGALYCKNPDRENGPCPKVKTHPVRFITACENGHVDDFPWEFYVHKGTNYDAKKCKLYLEDSGQTGSLKDLIVQCTTCEKDRSISEALSNNKILGKCTGRRPWLKDKEPDCEKNRKLLLRGASNIYFSSLESSIVIPSSKADENLDQFVKDNIDFNDEELMNDRDFFNKYYKRNADINRIGLEKVWGIVQRLKNVSSPEEEDLKKPEYEALLMEQYNYEGIDFETKQEDVPYRYSGLISNLVKVKRLKEVMVLKGFTRIHPAPDVTARLSKEYDEKDDESNEQVKFAPLSAERLNWLPGVETYGEGIFLTLNNDRLKDWERKFEEYENSVERAHRKIYLERDMPEEAIPPFQGIRYILLHTLSHALMRELTLHSGYSSSALKERIYSDNQNGMAGILIYTSTVDSEGSLGGLVELGSTDKFESIMARALAAARYCSGDPQCAEHDAQALTDVNGAACHSCMLIAETSCENSNRYLDRSIMVETVANYQREFFKNENE
ncbi:DrmB family protein [Lentibacillus sediminis]|uniref:DrmB family protein n=1 Tax=Lentibacillus sediminis TaxID=1940529 RepID=UPI000C1C807D|nr:DrmB family protein [Lentibacillus sediminis]